MATPKVKEIDIRKFSGGLNTRDTPSELAPDELVDALNVTIDERGGVVKRLGYVRRFINPVGAGLVKNLYWWKSKGQLVSQVGTGMHIDDAAAFMNWTTDARCGIVEFAGDLVLVHPVDGVRVYDGTTVTGPFANAPKGNTIAAWQNKIWVAGDPDNPPRVTRSDLGTASVWSVNEWTDLREKDSTIITCLTGAAGLDVSGRPGLLAFKAESAYRIYDSTTGAYNTIDASVGCSSNIGAVTAYGRTFAGSHQGIYYTTGLEPMVEASAKIENFFTEDQVNHDQMSLVAAGKLLDRLYFSFPRAGATANGVVIEIHPLAGWVMPHSNAASAYALADDTLIFGSPSVAGRIFDSHSGGSDDGVAIASQWQCYWNEPNFGNKTRIRRLRFVGMGDFDAYLYKDYEKNSNIPKRSVSITANAGVYDDPNAIYDTDDLYGPVAYQSYQDFYSIGVVRSFSIRVEESSTTTLGGQEVIDGALSPETGAWRLSSIKVMTIDLGFR